ncbi:MAG: tRNA 2-thiocytidine(32) synthetase TtcA [Deltaproteobacteria bacterium]|nr:tRNA 2-thiocytidine(32) synthetase TtcA [Deltaproteobacteria bacterium]
MLPASLVQSRCEKRLYRNMRHTAEEFSLLADGDRILCAISGGKDSHVMLHLLHKLVSRLPFEVHLIAVHLDQKQPGYDGSTLVAFLEESGVTYEILSEDTYSVVTDHVDEGSTYCSLCSRLRRGILYTAAERLGCNKLALGHHRDDALETFLMNLFFSGRMQSMPPKYTTNDGRFEVIRPLIECSEVDIAGLAEELDFPIIPCNLCGSQDGMQRDRMTALLDDLEADNASVRSIMAAALKNVRPTHMHDADVLAAWNVRPTDIRPDKALGPRKEHAAAMPVASSRRGLPVLP